MASGLTKQAAELPKIASISPSLSLPKIQNTNGGPAIGGTPGHHTHHPGHGSQTIGGHFGTEAAAAATASTAAVGEAVNQVIFYKVASKDIR